MSNMFWLAPGLYAVSRISKAKQWRQRRCLFKQRPQFKLADHIRDFECPADKTRLLQILLKGVYLSLDVPVAKLRATDRLDVELRVPSDKLHSVALDEYFDSLECMMPHDTEYPEAAFDIRACSLKSLFDYLCGCLGNNDIEW